MPKYPLPHPRLPGFLVFVCIFSALLPRGFAQSRTGSTPEREVTPLLFPSLYFTEHLQEFRGQEASNPYWAATADEYTRQAKARSDRRSILLNEDILAFYGHPLSRQMGILGRHSIENLAALLTGLAEEYRAVSGGREIRTAFYIIYGTVWPEGEIGILREAVLLEYIEYALQQDMLVFIDHQIGRYSPEAAIRKMLPYLKYPNVHLALDPEWRTTKPMREIGGVNADEINQAQRLMENYLVEHDLPGERMLVIHQFNWRMIRDRERVRGNFDRVRLVHCADGFGAPQLKRDTYAYNAQAANIPIKGFKLFYNFNIPGAGYDYPLLSPQEVYQLSPRPYLIMYQ
jgi:hypothetical protein